MNRIIALALVLPLIAAPAFAQSGSGKTPPGQREGGSLGELTKAANEDPSWDQGQHASQQPNPRAGLANVDPDHRGDLSATLDLVQGASE
ncbi:hypothetical protein [Tropicimonas sp. IMCC6043]|uniref:hypothetical protein n=1 Tax=Tropicimonas sp. IMCC6043 TaxID=2510645 RepID=UPI00101C3B46|nr:hypothetical protein [Tropicimonas sp. IMCC6043]RYH06741.1 hypothetical protein EU800_22815 [Tropicimonas sp. IMCC6043]